MSTSLMMEASKLLTSMTLCLILTFPVCHGLASMKLCTTYQNGDRPRGAVVCIRHRREHG